MNGTNTTPNPSSIYVFQSESGQYRVWPPVLVVPRGTNVSICNFTPVDLTVRFPDRAGIRLNPINPGGRAVFAPGVSGGYAFEVLVDGFRAAGHSDPSIIVD